MITHRVLLLALVAAVLHNCSGAGQNRVPNPESVAGSDNPSPGKQEKAAEINDSAIVKRPQFDPNQPSACKSHTDCYLQAKRAYASGQRAGYLLTVEKCEFYRGRYQLEQFYGVCLFMLADAYRHLGNFSEAINCYQRFLDTQPHEHDLVLQARQGIEEVQQGQKEPELYRNYLRAVSLLVQYNQKRDERLLAQARKILEDIHGQRPDCFLDHKVVFVLEQILGSHKDLK